MISPPEMTVSQKNLDFRHQIQYHCLQRQSGNSCVNNIFDFSIHVLVDLTSLGKKPSKHTKASNCPIQKLPRVKIQSDKYDGYVGHFILKYLLRGAVSHFLIIIVIALKGKFNYLFELLCVMCLFVYLNPILVNPISPFCSSKITYKL